MPAPPACRVESESLVVGMALVPGLVSRNRSFALFEDLDVRRASRRAAMLRGIVRHLLGAHGDIASLRIAKVKDRCELCYSLPGMKMQRRASLSDMELACVRYLASRAGASGIKPSDQDRDAIDAALRRLAGGLRLAELDVDPPHS